MNVHDVNDGTNREEKKSKRKKNNQKFEKNKTTTENGTENDLSNCRFKLSRSNEVWFSNSTETQAQACAYVRIIQNWRINVISLWIWSIIFDRRKKTQLLCWEPVWTAPAQYLVNNKNIVNSIFTPKSHSNTVSNSSSIYYITLAINQAKWLYHSNSALQAHLYRTLNLDLQQIGH